MNPEEMYREHILELYKHPHNNKPIADATHVHDGINPSCGDQLKVFLKVKNNVIEDVGFIGKGCAIHMAASSLVTDAVKGKRVEEVKHMLSADMLKLIEIPISPGRIRCALLAWDTIQQALK